MFFRPNVTVFFFRVFAKIALDPQRFGGGGGGCGAPGLLSILTGRNAIYPK